MNNWKLGQDSLPGISPVDIARIENGEVVFQCDRVEVIHSGNAIDFCYLRDLLDGDHFTHWRFCA